ncbi:hypothetical protein TNCV_1456891 [Trichonephila clavipes]|nr:hypothetical protein TNCV_1456891 [Trichonephila clavipes]
MQFSILPSIPPFVKAWERFVGGWCRQQDITLRHPKYFKSDSNSGEGKLDETLDIIAVWTVMNKTSYYLDRR